MPMPVSEAFMQQIRALRASRRWSQERASENCDMDHSLFSRLEGGSRVPTPESVAKIVAGFALDARRADALYAAAGFLPPSLAPLVAQGESDHLIYELARVLHEGGQRATLVAAALMAILAIPVAPHTKEAAR